MQAERFTIKSGEAIQAAQQAAQRAGNPEVTPLHLLAALMSGGPRGDGALEEGGLIVPLLEKAGAAVERVRSMAASELARLPKVSGGSLAAGRVFNDVIQAAEAAARKMKD